MSERAFTDAEAMSRAACADIAQMARESMRRDGSFSIALSGGNTPKRLYELLVGADIDWSRTHVFWSDERAVPPTDEKSNYKLANDTFLSKVKIPRDQIHRLEGERPDLDAAAKDAEAALKEFGALDLMLLGMGDDGHTASLFPGGPWLEEKSRLVVKSRAPVVPNDRLTMTLPEITSAREVWVLIGSAAKRPMLERALKGDVTIPAGLLVSKRPNVSFFTAR